MTYRVNFRNMDHSEQIEASLGNRIEHICEKHLASWTRLEATIKREKDHRFVVSLTLKFRNREVRVQDNGQDLGHCIDSLTSKLENTLSKLVGKRKSRRSKLVRLDSVRSSRKPRFSIENSFDKFATEYSNEFDDISIAS